MGEELRTLLRTMNTLYEACEPLAPDMKCTILMDLTSYEMYQDAVDAIGMATDAPSSFSEPLRFRGLEVRAIEEAPLGPSVSHPTLSLRVVPWTQ